MKTRIVTIAAALVIGTSGICHAGGYTNDFSSSVGAAQLRGNAVLDAGSVRLTENLGGQEGSLVINNLDPGRVVQSFDASFSIAIGPSGVPPADGVSFSFGPPPPGTYGESGAPLGVVVIFDLFDNGEIPTPPVIRIVVNGSQVAAAQITLDSGGAFRPVTVHVDSNGLDLNYNSGGLTFTDIALPGFSPTQGYQFTFGGRTGGANAEQRIDDVSIATASVAPAPVPTLGEWAMMIMAGLLACFGAFTLRRSRRPTGS
ncbi:MAG TPA: IPTL-CTERM sorting domain-containing protein [Steroidobacteraceae bacterium]|jgi:hypothetical protein